VVLLSEITPEKLRTFEGIDAWVQVLYRNVQRFRGGLVLKAHRLCVSFRVIKKKRRCGRRGKRVLSEITPDKLRSFDAWVQVRQTRP